MLRQHVERAAPVHHRILRVGLGRFQRRAALQHLEAVGRHQDRFRRLIEPMVGAANTLDQAAGALGSANVNHQVHITPVDAEIERGRRHHGLELAGRHSCFHFATLTGRQRAVVEGDRQAVLVDAPQLLEQQLGLHARVDEQQRQAMRLDGGVNLGDRMARRMARPRQAGFRIQNLDVRLGARLRLD